MVCPIKFYRFKYCTAYVSKNFLKLIPKNCHHLIYYILYEVICSLYFIRQPNRIYNISKWLLCQTADLSIKFAGRYAGAKPWIFCITGVAYRTTWSIRGLASRHLGVYNCSEYVDLCTSMSLWRGVHYSVMKLHYI